MVKSRNNKRDNTKLYRWIVVGAVSAGFFGMLVYALVMREEIRTTALDVPLITAPETPVKRRPDQPGGMEIPNRDKLVFDLLAPNVRSGDSSISSKAVKNVKVAAKVIPKVVKKEIPITKSVPSVSSAPKEEKKIITAKVEKPVLKVEPKSVVVEKPKSEPKIETAIGPWGVQLASFVTKADAQKALSTYSKKYNSLIGKLTHYVQQVELGQGKGTRYRAQFFGLKNKSEAIGLCSQLKRKKQGCLHVKR